MLYHGSNHLKEFKIHKDYWDSGCDIFLKEDIAIHPGLTVLVGCNGAGKSTMMMQLRDSLTEQKIKFLAYDNLRDGGESATSWAGYCGDYSKLATMIQSSEGENIVINVENFAGKIGNFVKSTNQTEIWVFLDAVDSGMSIDNIVEIKNFFDFAQKNDPSKTFFFIVSANEYEMAREANCFSVRDGEYVSFKDYEDFRNFILHSREMKDSRKYKERKR